MEKYIDMKGLKTAFEQIKKYVDKQDKEYVLGKVGVPSGMASLDASGNVPLSQLGNVDTTLFEIVKQLPENITERQLSHIFIVSRGTDEGSTQNIYKEYIYTGKAGSVDYTLWEELGEFTSEVDLTGYAKKTQAVGSVKVDSTKGAVAQGKPTHYYTDIFFYDIDGNQLDRVRLPCVGDLGTAPGLMSYSDKTKLDSIDTDALAASISDANTAAASANTAADKTTTATTACQTATTECIAATEACKTATEESAASVTHLNETMGPYSERPSITLTPTATGYVIDSNGAKVSKSGWAMAEFTAEKGNVYLFKPGATDGNVSVFAEAISSVETRGIDYTYTYNSDGTIATATATYGGKTHTYIYTYGSDGTATIKEGSTVISELPMTYTTTVGSYSPLVRLNANAELPEDGYCRYMSHFKGNSSIKVVVSYKVGAADLTMKVTRDGVLASISTQLGNLSQKEDETRNLLTERAPKVWANVLAVKDCAINVDGKIVELPAHKNVVIKDFKVVSVAVNENYYSPKWIRRFDIHAIGIMPIEYLKLGAYGKWKDIVNDVAGVLVTSLDVSNFDISKVTDMSYMFSDCSSLTSLDVSGFDTSNVKRFYCMFSGCSSLTSLDVSGWDTSKVTEMRYMFNGCSSLTTLDVSNFDTNKVTDMYCMFSRCTSLTNLLFGSKWGTQTSTAADALTLSLSNLGSSKSYKLTDATYSSMLTMYDRATAGLTTMTIKIGRAHV